MSGCVTLEINLQKSFPSPFGVSGSDTNPVVVDPTVGIVFTGAANENFYYLKALSPITISAALQISPGSFVGQRLTLFTFDDINTITIQGPPAPGMFSYRGLWMNGDWKGGLGSSITYTCSQSLIWRETGRV